MAHTRAAQAIARAWRRSGCWRAIQNRPPPASRNPSAELIFIEIRPGRNAFRIRTSRAHPRTTTAAISITAAAMVRATRSAAASLSGVDAGTTGTRVSGVNGNIPDYSLRGDLPGVCNTAQGPGMPAGAGQASSRAALMKAL
jgi:hypothetical protein